MNDMGVSIFFYSANFVFILTNLYGWILKSFYRPKLYRDNYDNLFPSQKANAALYLLQVFEIPYLLMIGEPKALFYVNAFSILLFSSLMVVMCDICIEAFVRWTNGCIPIATISLFGMPGV